MMIVVSFYQKIIWAVLIEIEGIPAISVPDVLPLSKRYEEILKVIFNQGSKLHSTPILKGLYALVKIIKINDK